jgi:hypothetical protein
MTALIPDELAPLDPSADVTDAKYVRGAPRSYATVAAVRADPDSVLCARVIVAGKGYDWTPGSTTADTTDEDTTSIAVTGNTTGRHIQNSLNSTQVASAASSAASSAVADLAETVSVLYPTVAAIRAKTDAPTTTPLLCVTISSVLTHFAWSSGSTTADDGVSVLQITGVTTGRFLRGEAYAAGQISSAIAAIPDATPLVRGLCTTAQAGIIAKALRVDQTASTTGVAMTSGATTTLLAVTLTELAASTNYLAVVSVRARIWKAGATATAAMPQLTQLVHIATNGSSVATVTPLGSPRLDTVDCSLIPTASASIAASTGGFTISGIQTSGEARVGEATVRLLDLTVVS